MSRPLLVVFWLLRVFVGAMFLLAALPKLTGDPAAIDTFTTLGVEPWGRLATGAIEVLAGVLVLVPKTVLIGAVLVAVTMLGALGAHATKLGFAGDAGGMAVLAALLLVAAIGVVFIALKLRGSVASARPWTT